MYRCSQALLRRLLTLPGFGNNPNGPEYIITYNANGTFSTGLNPTYAIDPGPYDGIEDTYFGVINNNAGVIDLPLPFWAAGSNIFGFDGDGINTYLGIANNPNDPSGYGGPNSYFNAVNADNGTVIFGSGIQPGGTEIFSLEEKVAIDTLVVSQGSVPEPSTWAMMLLGFAGLGFLSLPTIEKAEPSSDSSLSYLREVLGAKRPLLLAAFFFG